MFQGGRQHLWLVGYFKILAFQWRVDGTANILKKVIGNATRCGRGFVQGCVRMASAGESETDTGRIVMLPDGMVLPHYDRSGQRGVCCWRTRARRSV